MRDGVAYLDLLEPRLGKELLGRVDRMEGWDGLDSCDGNVESRENYG